MITSLSPFTIKILSCLWSLASITARDPEELNFRRDLAYACVMKGGQQISLTEKDFEQLQKEMSLMFSKQCEAEAERYADKYCSDEKKEECHDRQYDRCEKAYEADQRVRILDIVYDFGERIFDLMRDR